MRAELPQRQRVGVIGSGMAGLVTAYLLRTDASNRYEVEVFEKVRSSSILWTKSLLISGKI